MKKALAALVALSVLWGLTGSAQAATVYRPDGSTFATPGSGEGEANPQQIAVEQDSGNVLVASSYPQRVSVYAPEGGSAKFLTGFGEGELLFPAGIAVDESSHAVYVTDPFLGEIVKYDRTSTSPPTYVRDAAFTSPAAGAEPGQIGSFSSPLAVDPATGDLLVADRGNQRISRYEADGTFVASFDGSGAAAGSFHNLSSLAVAPSGEIYVVDITEGDISFENGNSVVERFASDGTADPSFAPEVPKPRTVGYDAAAENLVVTGRSDRGVVSPHPAPIRLYVLHDDQLVDEADFPAGNEGSISTGLAVDLESPHRLYAATVTDNFGGGFTGVTVFEALHAPDVALAAPTAIGTSSVQLSGSVNPLGESTSYHFEYSREGGPVQETDAVAVGEGTTAVPVAFTLTGLVANSDYTVQLVATNGQSSIGSHTYSFHTLASAPEAVTGGAFDLTRTSATLRGRVNPFGQQTVYWFEYGTTSAYGLRVPADHGGVAGAGRDALNVSQGVTGLQPGTTYHYRLIAENATGSSQGEDRTFTTDATGLPARAYELVTPADKGGSNAYPNWVHVAPSGDVVTYEMRTAIPGKGGSAPQLPRYTSARGEEGWSTVGLDPPLLPTPRFVPIFSFDALAVSEDGTRAVVMSTKKLAEGATDGDTNFYLFDIASGTYRTIATTPGFFFFEVVASAVINGSEVVVGGTPNFSRIVLQTENFPAPLLEGVVGAGTYEWSEEDGLRLVAENSTAAANGESRDPHAVSEDGSTIIYRGEDRRLHAQVDGTENLEISGDPGLIDQELIGATADGSLAYTQANFVLYRYDFASHELTPLADKLPQQAGLGVSADGAYVYYLREVPSGGGIWVWHDGEQKLVAPLAGSITLAREIFRASPNGRYFIFGSKLPLTGFDSEGNEEIFRYDAEAEELTCASCRTDGLKPTGDAHSGWRTSFFEFYTPRSVLDNGEVFFDTPDPLVSADVNSNRDVYAFDGERQRLVSAGTGDGDSIFGDASPSGNDVFFTTADRLVKADQDDAIDVYDARVGGGIAAQNAASEGAACTGVGCRGEAPASPPPPPTGSESRSGSGNVTSPHRKRCGKGKHLVRKGGRTRCVENRAHGNRRHAR